MYVILCGNGRMSYPHPPLRGTLSRSRERVGVRPVGGAKGNAHPPLRGTLSRSRERVGVRAPRAPRVHQ